MKLLFALAMLLGSWSVSANDACRAQIPRALEQAITSKYPDFRAPLVTDNLSEDVEYAQEKHQSPCIGVAAADFNGDGSLDKVIALTALRGKSAVVIVAIQSGKIWKLHELTKWAEGRSRLYVDTDKPGTYYSVLEAVSGLGEVEKLSCKNSFAIFGMTESTGVAYCLRKGKWRYTWFSD